MSPTLIRTRTVLQKIFKFVQFFGYVRKLFGCEFAEPIMASCASFQVIIQIPDYFIFDMKEGLDSSLRRLIELLNHKNESSPSNVVVSNVIRIRKSFNPVVPFLPFNGEMETFRASHLNKFFPKS